MAKRLLLAWLIVVLLAGVTVAPAAAADFRSGETIIIGRNEVVEDDVFVAAETILVDGTIKGNLFAAGSSITVNGTVDGSVFAAAQTIVINGKVTGLVMGGGMSLTVGRQATIDRNAVVGAFAVTGEAGSVIRRDLVIGAAQAQLRGEVGRDVKFAGSALEIDGRVGRNVDAAVESDTPRTTGYGYWPGLPESITPGLRVGPEATVAGALTYHSIVEQAGGIRGKVGSVRFERVERADVSERGASAKTLPEPINWLIERLRDVVTLMALGLILLRLAPWLLSAADERLRRMPTASLGWGLLVGVAGYVAIGLAIIVLTVIGLILAMLTLGKLAGISFMAGLTAWGAALIVFQLVVTYGSKLVVSYVIGKLVLTPTARRYAEKPVWALLAGVVLYVVVRSIPVFGWLVGLAATLLGLGALWLALKQRPVAAVA